MNAHFQKLCEEEIKGLLSKGLIRHSRSPWNCYGFYVNKYSEKIRGVPQIVVNYKPLNKVVADDTYLIPHKSSLVNKIAGAKIFSKSQVWILASSHKRKTSSKQPLVFLQDIMNGISCHLGSRILLPNSRG